MLAPDPDPSRRNGDRGVHGLLGRRRAARPAAPGPGLLAGPVRHVAGRGGEHLDLGPEEAHEAGEAGVVLGGGQVPDQSASGVGGLARKTGISRSGMDPLDFSAASGAAETTAALAEHRHVGPGRGEAIGRIHHMGRFSRASASALRLRLREEINICCLCALVLEKGYFRTQTKRTDTATLATIALKDAGQLRLGGSSARRKA